MERISAVYQIINIVTGDSYVGSSKDVKRRWREHKKPSVWKKYPNIQLYIDMYKQGIENFRFQILAPVEPKYLVQVEQSFIEMLQPTYNNHRANGLDVERKKERGKKYNQSEKGKKYQKKYYNQLCSYNGETLTLGALASRFCYAGIPHPYVEAKKYLLPQQ